ncbi:MAG TPA: ATPase [Firmicutes bacterium]|nr:ATPase [Bacillota bacterium]
MERKIYQDLLKWKSSSGRKPLILQGPRQVGKTYITNLFGSREYANVVYCNFEQDEFLNEFFTVLEPERIIKMIEAHKRKQILKEKTLIIFDEIQYCPRALTSLKYFNEEANEYHIIATGSLLGVSLNRGNNSFPVGKVNFLNMGPMDFEEFLLAQEEKNSFLIDEIKKCYKEDSPLAKPFHNTAMELYKNYLFVGGMPEVVEEFVKTNNFELVRIKQYNILQSYFNDMSKYNKATEIPKVKLVYKNITTQLAKENKKFKYSLIKSGGRAREFEDAIEWLCLAGVAKQLHRIEQIKLPLDAFISLDDFKFYMNDVGLCCANQNVHFDDIILNNDSFEFRGGLTENYVFNQLTTNNLPSFYWTNKNSAEIDFITRIGEDIIPIEVKSGENTRAKSLSIYIQQFKPKYAIKISAKNFGFEENIKSVPLYAAFCIK